MPKIIENSPLLSLNKLDNPSTHTRLITIQAIHRTPLITANYNHTNHNNQLENEHINITIPLLEPFKPPASKMNTLTLLELFKLPR